jgi:hypothetical protein
LPSADLAAENDRKPEWGHRGDSNENSCTKHTDRPCIIPCVMDAREKMNVGLGRTSLVVAASDGPGG